MNKHKILALAIMVLFSMTHVSGEDSLGFKLLGQGINELQLLGHNIYILTVVFKQGDVVIYNDLLKMIAMNPNIKENILLENFMKLILPFYVLAIAGTGVFIMFISSSPSRSARAKAMISRLVICMIATSLSPKILELVLNLSETFTYSILNQMPSSAYINIVKDFAASFGGLYLKIGQLDTALGFFFPGIWIWMLFWGSYTVIIVRYMIIVLFTGLLPLTILFYSFGITRDLGKNMLEQLILWTAMQEFIASTTIATVLCVGQSGALGLFNISGAGNFLIFTGAGFIVLAPFLMTRIFRNFLPG